MHEQIAETISKAGAPSDKAFKAGTEPLAEGIHLAPQRKTFPHHLTVFASAALMALSSCGGNVAGKSERANWLPAYTISVSQDGTPTISDDYLGLDSPALFGFNRFYPSISDIPPGLMDDQQRLAGLLFTYLSATAFDFSTQRISATLQDLAFVYMTDLGTWPNAVYSEDMCRDYGMLMLDAQAQTVSDCSSGNCIRPDMMMLNDKTSFFPAASSMDSLSGTDKSQAMDLASSLSEELLHAIWHRGLSQAEEDSFSSLISSLWSASSSDISSDGALASAWMGGGVAFAINSDGSVNYYNLQNPVRGAIMTVYPSMSGNDVDSAEIASISYLQLIGRFAYAFAGSGENYLDYYIQNDQANGVQQQPYTVYRSMFITRESYPHTGRMDGYRLILPMFLEHSFEPQMRPEYLAGIFNDGIQNPVSSQNPYLSDPAKLAALASDVIPVALGMQK